MSVYKSKLSICYDLISCGEDINEILDLYKKQLDDERLYYLTLSYFSYIKKELMVNMVSYYDIEVIHVMKSHINDINYNLLKELCDSNNINMIYTESFIDFSIKPLEYSNKNNLKKALN